MQRKYFFHKYSRNPLLNTPLLWLLNLSSSVSLSASLAPKQVYLDWLDQPEKHDNLYILYLLFAPSFMPHSHIATTTACFWLFKLFFNVLITVCFK